MTGIARATAFGLLAALAFATLAAAGTARNERVRIVDPAPLTLRGLDFSPGEQVKLSVSLGDVDVRRTLQAGRAGGFRTVFSRLHYDRCHGPLAVTAVGSRGSKVAWKVVPLDCPDRADS
jgi:hypothetical protein